MKILNFKLWKANGTLAQMVEQWTENPCVPSSILGGATMYLCYDQ